MGYIKMNIIKIFFSYEMSMHIWISNLGNSAWEYYKINRDFKISMAEYKLEKIRNVNHIPKNEL